MPPARGRPDRATRARRPDAALDPFDPTFFWHGCPSPWQVKLVEEGLFAFEVRAIDRAGNTDPSPDVHFFGGVGDFDAPDTFFTLTPPNPSSGTNAVFGFSGNDGAGTPAQFLEFECRIDTLNPEAWLECTSPASFSNLAPGEHTVQVRAADGADNVDPTPATYTWTVGTPTTCEDGNITLFAVADTFVDEASIQENFGGPPSSSCARRPAATTRAPSSASCCRPSCQSTACWSRRGCACTPSGDRVGRSRPCPCDGLVGDAGDVAEPAGRAGDAGDDDVG